MKCNPFSTRFVQPGKLEWLPYAGIAPERLVAHFEGNRRARGAIVGPHGTGKSTLLECVVPRLGRVCWRRRADDAPPTGGLLASRDSLASRGTLARAGVLSSTGNIVWLGLRRSRSPLRWVLHSKPYWKLDGLLVLDGLEQLRPWERWFVLALSRFHRTGLLATSHREMASLSTLAQTDCHLEVVRKLVNHLLLARPDVDADVGRKLAEEPLLQSLIAEESGNIREIFMRLYDRFEEVVNSHAKHSPHKKRQVSWQLD